MRCGTATEERRRKCTYRPSANSAGHSERETRHKEHGLQLHDQTRDGSLFRAGKQPTPGQTSIYISNAMSSAMESAALHMLTVAAAEAAVAAAVEANVVVADAAAVVPAVDAALAEPPAAVTEATAVVLDAEATALTEVTATVEVVTAAVEVVTAAVDVVVAAAGGAPVVADVGPGATVPPFGPRVPFSARQSNQSS